MLGWHGSDSPYVNIIISAYSLVNIMLEATSSSQTLQYCSTVALGKHSLLYYKQNTGTGKALYINRTLIGGNCPKKVLNCRGNSFSDSPHKLKFVAIFVK